MLLGGQQIAITKRGRIIALLVEPSKIKRLRKLDWKKRFAAPVTEDEPRTDVVGLLLREREETL
jgi:antitoxin (DNA-binding transcriptional repressor) of toxin-antitoxin stability system